MGQSSFEGEGEGCLGDGMSKDRCCDKESPRLQLPHAVNMELMIDQPYAHWYKTLRICALENHANILKPVPTDKLFSEEIISAENLINEQCCFWRCQDILFC